MATNARDDSDIVLALDVGSSSLRAQLYTLTGEGLPGCEVKLTYQTWQAPEGGIEIDPSSLLARLSEAIDMTLACAGDKAKRIRGVGICSQVMNVLGVDSTGNPTTPIYTWSDLRGESEARELRHALPDREILERTGCVIHTSYLPTRLLWLRRARADEYARTDLWLSLGDWVYTQLFGRAAQSLSVASWGGLLNRHTLDWDEQLLSLLGIGRERLPTLMDADHRFTGLAEPYADRWPQLHGVPWFPCIGDGAGGNLGSGCVTPDALAVQVGTSGAMRALVPGVPSRVPDGLWCYRLDREYALLGGSLSGGANVVRWFEKLLGRNRWEQAKREATLLEPDTHGLTILPLLAGERSLGWHPGARGVVAGLSLGTTPAHILRALQEAITYQFALIYDALTPVLPAVSDVMAGGGELLGDDDWPGMLADVLGRPVTSLRDMQASSRGVAMLAFKALGLITSFEEVAAPRGKAYEPDMSRHARYQEGMERQGEPYRAMYGKGQGKGI
jgi:gluconokinase